MPERSARGDVVERKQIKFFPQPPVVALFNLFLKFQIIVQLFFGSEGEAVNSRQHRFFFVAAPVSAGGFGQLESVGVYFRSVLHVAAAAEINERIGRIEFRVADAARAGGVNGKAASGQFFDEFQFKRLVFKQYLRFFFTYLFSGKNHPLLDKPFYHVLNFRQFLVFQRAGQKKVVIKAVFNDGSDAELGVGHLF